MLGQMVHCGWKEDTPTRKNPRQTRLRVVPGIITNIHQETGNVALRLFPPGEEHLERDELSWHNVPFSKTPALGCWFWPPREEVPPESEEHFLTGDEIREVVNLTIATLGPNHTIIKKLVAALSVRKP